MKIQNKNRAIYMPIILALVLILGILIGNQLNNKKIDDRFFIYPRTNKLSLLLNYIEQEYVDSVSKEDLIEKAIPRVLENLDPHSIYIPKEDLKEMNEPLEGKFDGIGIQFNIQKDTIIVINTISGGPSEKMGIIAGDRIVKVNDTLVAGVKISNSDVMKKLKGKRGTKVIVSISRRNTDELLDFTITRDKIPLHSVDVAYMITPETGYIKISKFARNTHQEFLEKIALLKQQQAKKVIIDLRGNGGGYMDAATNIADEFLSSNELIVYTDGYARDRRNINSNLGGTCNDLDVAVLIDEWSASASEILAGAIQDNDRGMVIGRRSFGKGLVQEPTMFPDGSALRLTIARYYTPTGRCIQKPYDNIDDYHGDIGLRYLHGEFEQQDSIKFADSLRYTTPKGKIVYGGGGIMPDVFIPVDTIGISPYLTKISNKGLVYSFAFEYTDTHRKELGKFNNSIELEKHLNTQELLGKFTKYAKSKGVNPNQKDIKISGYIIETQLKAYIARNILDDEGFYPIIKNIDHTLLKALDLL